MYKINVKQWDKIQCDMIMYKIQVKQWDKNLVFSV